MSDVRDAIERLSERQRDVLGAIAINQDGGHHPKTLAVLVQRGLIEEYDELLSFRDGLPPMKVKRYAVPLNVHVEWCQWCSENVGDDE